MSSAGDQSSIYSEAVSSAGDMSQELAKRLFSHGGVIIVRDMLEGSQFGIDYSVWSTGPNFIGVKMIPPGIHYIYYSAVSKDRKTVPPRIGFFHCFKEKEILVKRWDNQKEDLAEEADIDEDTVARYRSNLVDLDPSLGAYPFDKYKKWFSLSSHIKEDTISRLSPLESNGRISTQCELITKESQDVDYSACVTKDSPIRTRYTDEQGLPIMTERPGTEIRFTRVPGLGLSSGSTSAERTRVGMDNSDRLDQLIRITGSEAAILAELQFAFVCFVIGQVYHSFEQWKRIVRVCCSCDDALVKREQFYHNLILVLHHQLKEIPEDFFVDIVSKDNFLTHFLSNLFGLVRANDAVSSSLRGRCEKFKAYLTKKYRWDFSQDLDEFQPVVVGLDGY